MTGKYIIEEIEQLLSENYRQYYRLAFSYVKNEQDALDIVQESAYKAVKNSHKVKNSEYVRTWLYRIVVNTSLDFLRKRKPEVSYEEQEEIGYEPEEKGPAVLEMLQILDKKEQTILILRYFEELKLEEIAEILGKNLNTVKAKLYRSLKKLKEDFKEADSLGGGNYV